MKTKNFELKSFFVAYNNENITFYTYSGKYPVSGLGAYLKPYNKKAKDFKVVSAESLLLGLVDFEEFESLTLETVLQLIYFYYKDLFSNLKPLVRQVETFKILEDIKNSNLTPEEKLLEKIYYEKAKNWWL